MTQTTPHGARQRAGWPAIALVAAAALASTVGALTSAHTLCPVALLTGTACPGCGMTRAVVALARGDLRASWTAHPLAPVMIVQAATGMLLWVSTRRGRGAGLSTRHVTLTAGATAAVLVVVWLARYALGTLPVV